MIVKRFAAIIAVAAIALAVNLATPTDVNAQIGTCGPAERSYAASDTSFSGALCSFGTQTPSSVSFPAQGGSVTWTCVGTTTDTCTASRGGTPSSSGNTIQPEDLWGGHSGGSVTEESLRGNTGLGNKDPRAIAASVVNVVLGFLGIIAVLLILAGGFRWMTAQGNDEAIAGAKNLMMAGVIGLIIILAAFGIARFVINALVGATI